MPQERIGQQPPIAVWLVDQFTPYNQAEAIPGDLLEEFSDIASRQGIASARRWYWRQSVKTIAHLIADGLRVASWLIVSSTVGACLLGWCLFWLTETTVNVVLHRYHVYHHVSAPVFWLVYALLVERLVNPMFMGGMVGLVVKGRELPAAITLSFFIGISSALGLVLMATADTPRGFPSWHADAMVHLRILRPLLVTTFLSPIMIVIGGVIVRKVRSAQNRMDKISG